MAGTRNPSPCGPYPINGDHHAGATSVLKATWGSKLAATLILMVVSVVQVSTRIQASAGAQQSLIQFPSRRINHQGLGHKSLIDQSHRRTDCSQTLACSVRIMAELSLSSGSAVLLLLAA